MKVPSAHAVLLATTLGMLVALPKAPASVEPEQSPSTTPPAVSAEPEIDWEVKQRFWSFQPPVAQPLPAVHDRQWPRERLDAFVLARIEENGLAPAAEADRRTLVRRVTFDLTGLPPTPEEATAFVADRAADAYSRLVDRLLSSPRFGERMASLWLPLARYAEDQAHQVGDDTSLNYPDAYLYRAWVIDAFNRDVPYNDFLRLQLAADKYEGCSDDLPALGFLGLGPKYYNRNRLDVKADEWEDRVDTVTRTILGLTVACARCHDHKFDPIPSSDYYALAGVFASTRMVNVAPDGKVVDRKTKADAMPPGTLHIVQDADPEDLHIFLRGRVDNPGKLAPRAFLHVLSENGRPTPFQAGSGRRELAERLTARDNPLTARVIVNRLWARLFGRPLVGTPSNFGHSGMTPTHPELLDDLAVRFMDGGWSVRHLVRELVLSATYRQAAATPPEQERRDPANEWLSHMNRRRLTIEQWRDAVLFLAGDLEWSGGPSVELDDPRNRRRTVYGRISRQKLDDMLREFDYPDANVHASRRAVTTTASQKLFMLNSPFILQEARAFAARLAAGAGADETGRITEAYRLAFGRTPTSSELDVALGFVHGPDAEGLTRWDQFAQVVLISNEMLYVD